VQRPLGSITGYEFELVRPPIHDDKLVFGFARPKASPRRQTRQRELIAAGYFNAL
jgi:hypothetical protein